MVGTTLMGAALLGVAYVGSRFTPDRKMKKLLETIVRDRGLGVENADGRMRLVSVKRVVRKKYGYRVTFLLPVGFTVSKFEQAKEVFEQATQAEIQIKRTKGRLVYMDFGMIELHESMNYKSDLTDAKAPVVPLFTPFGIHELNFWDDASCHLLIGGATRMGKSVFLRLILISIMERLDGRARFYVIDNKIEDLFPFRRVPQIESAETIEEAKILLFKAKQEVMRRRQLLKTTGDCVNMRQYREQHSGEDVPPLFVVIDEYGRMADDDEIQECIVELAETSGSYDVHLIIASQRPDAATVLRPRIKANLLARIAFTTSDEANSSVIIGTPDAAHLGRVKGRALLLDGMLSTVHVPYVSEKQAIKALERFKVQEVARSTAPLQTPPQTPALSALPPFVAQEIARLGGDDEDDAEQPGQKDFEIPRTVPRFVTGADRGVGLFGIDFGSDENSQDKPGA